MCIDIQVSKFQVKVAEVVYSFNTEHIIMWTKLSEIWYKENVLKF